MNKPFKANFNTFLFVVLLQKKGEKDKALRLRLE